MKIIRGCVASRKGLPRYFTGKPCAKRNHIVERYTSTGHCVECARIDIKETEVYKRRLEYLKTPEGKARQLCQNAKSRAKKKGLDFDITPNDIFVPDVCPLLEVKIDNNRDKVAFDSPTLDRIDPSKGYIRGNIMVISFRANTIKSNATLNELKQLVSNLERFV